MHQYFRYYLSEMMTGDSTGAQNSWKHREVPTWIHAGTSSSCCPSIVESHNLLEISIWWLSDCSSVTCYIQNNIYNIILLFFWLDNSQCWPQGRMTTPFSWVSSDSSLLSGFLGISQVISAQSLLSLPHWIPHHPLWPGCPWYTLL